MAIYLIRDFRCSFAYSYLDRLVTLNMEKINQFYYERRKGGASFGPRSFLTLPIDGIQ